MKRYAVAGDTAAWPSTRGLSPLPWAIRGSPLRTPHIFKRHKVGASKDTPLRQAFRPHRRSPLRQAFRPHSRSPLRTPHIFKRHKVGASKDTPLRQAFGAIRQSPLRCYPRADLKAGPYVYPGVRPYAPAGLRRGKNITLRIAPRSSNIARLIAAVTRLAGKQPGEKGDYSVYTQ